MMLSIVVSKFRCARKCRSCSACAALSESGHVFANKAALGSGTEAHENIGNRCDNFLNSMFASNENPASAYLHT